MVDYAHCEDCDKVINLDTETFLVLKDNTYCGWCGNKEIE